MILDNVATPDISASSTYIVMNTVTITDLLNGNPDDIRYFIFGNDESVFDSNTDMLLQGGESFKGGVGDTLTLIYDGTTWSELSRSLNPLFLGGGLDEYTLDSGYIINQINNINQILITMQQQLDMIGVTSADKLISLNPTMTQLDMQNAIDDFYGNLSNEAIVTIHFEDGTYNITEPLVVKDVRGDGRLVITSDDTSGFSPTKSVILDSHSFNRGFFEIRNCDVDVEMTGILGYYNLNDLTGEQGGLNIINARTVNVTECSFKTDDDISSDVYFSNSTGRVKSVYVENGNIGIDANDMSRVTIENCDDNSVAPKYGVASRTGSIVSFIDGQQPNGTVDNTLTNNGSQILS